MEITETQTRKETSMDSKVTDKQRSFLLKLIGEREPNADTDLLLKSLRISEDPEEFGLSKKAASAAIDALLQTPRKAPAPRPEAKPAAELTPGVFETDEGIFVVKPNQAKTRLYAKKLVPSTERLNANGDHVDFDFVYAPGAVYRLKESDRMDVERAKALTILYGRCICCGRHLKVAQSVERGIGPVCIKYFRAA